MTEILPIDGGQGPTSKGQGPTGPKTPEGKKACALNAYRQGLTSQLRIFTPDEQKAYDQHSKITLDALAPVSDYERSLAQSIADDTWRLIRARTIEDSIFAVGMRHSADSTGTPKSMTPSPRAAPGSTMPITSNSSPSTSSASSAPSTRTQPASRPCNPGARKPPRRPCARLSSSIN